ncbi:hypothetical protein AAVH_14692 [Aphelenchoides avenae]|nr:hypothetical protein AAVH_14692 [Aphelenchus avenae]
MADVAQPQLFLPTVHEVFGILIAGEKITGQEFAAAYSEIYHAKTSRGEVYKYVCDELAAHVESLFKHIEPRDVHELHQVAPPGKQALNTIFEICRHLHSHYIQRNGSEDVRTFAQRKYREGVVEKVLSHPKLLDDWLRGALDGVSSGVEVEDETKESGSRLLDAFEVCPDYYATHFSMPFIRDAIAFYHEKAKELISEDNPDAFEANKAEVLRLETVRAEAYLNEPHRSDYLTTLTELFDLGGEKFQRA